MCNRACRALLAILALAECEGRRLGPGHGETRMQVWPFLSCAVCEGEMFFDCAIRQASRKRAAGKAEGRWNQSLQQAVKGRSRGVHSRDGFAPAEKRSRTIWVSQ